MALFSHVVLKKNSHFGLKFHATENFAQYGWLVGWLVGWLEFNIPFQHKYGYFRDEFTQ